jgi:hypothetical protein
MFGIENAPRGLVVGVVRKVGAGVGCCCEEGALFVWGVV